MGEHYPSAWTEEMIMEVRRNEKLDSQWTVWEKQVHIVVVVVIIIAEAAVMVVVVVAAVLLLLLFVVVVTD